MIHAAVTQGSADIPKVHGKTTGKLCGKIIGNMGNQGHQNPPNMSRFGMWAGFSCSLIVKGLLKKQFQQQPYDSWFGGPNFTISAGSTHVSGRLSAKGSYSHTIGDQCNLSDVPAKVSK